METHSPFMMRGRGGSVISSQPAHTNTLSDKHTYAHYLHIRTQCASQLKRTYACLPHLTSCRHANEENTSSSDGVCSAETDLSEKESYHLMQIQNRKASFILNIIYLSFLSRSADHFRTYMHTYKYTDGEIGRYMIKNEGIYADRLMILISTTTCID